jgi:hypothetical protein
MKEAVGSPYTEVVRNDSIDRKGGNSLKKSLVAIALLAIVFISTGAFATAPKPGDIPDFRALVGQAAPDVTDLDAWVVDFDDKNFIADPDMTWTVNVSGGLTYSNSAANSLTLDAVGSVNASTLDFIVEDASGTVPAVTSRYKATNAIGLAPGLTSDPMLTDQTTVYTYVLQPATGTGAVDTVMTGSALVSGSAPTWESVYINAADGTTLASGLGNANVTGLSAAIDGAGNFTLTSTGWLSQPVIVGFKGAIGGDPNDWVGVSALVSNSLLGVDSVSANEPVNPAYDLNDGFEGTPGVLTQTAPFTAGVAGTSWVQNVNGTGSIQYQNATTVPIVAQVISSPGGYTPDASFPGDFSGQVLELQLEGGLNNAYAGWVQYFGQNTFAVEAGKVYCLEANVASSAATAADAPQLGLALSSSDFSQIAVSLIGGNTGAATVNGMPISSEGWTKMRVYMEPAAGAAASGVYPIFLAQNVANDGVTPLANNVSIYIDNVKFYETVSPDDLTFAAAKVDALGGGSRPDVAVGTARKQIYTSSDIANGAGQPFYGNFEAAVGAFGGGAVTTGGNANGWRDQLTSAGVTIGVVNTSNPLTRIESGDQNWLEISWDGTGAASSAASILSRPLVPEQVSGSAWDAGTYVLSADVETPAAQSSSPFAYVILRDDGFQSYSYQIVANPTSGGVSRVRVPYTFRDVDNIQVELAGQDTASGFNGQLHFDNVMLEYLDDAPIQYNDEALFN